MVMTLSTGDKFSYEGKDVDPKKIADVIQIGGTFTFPDRIVNSRQVVMVDFE